MLNSRSIKDVPPLQRDVNAFETAANTHHPPVPLDGKTSLEDERFVTFPPKLGAPKFTLTPRFRFQQVPEGNVSCICRIRKSGQITIATAKFDIDPQLAWDDVYATISVKERALKIYHKGERMKAFPSQLNL